MTSPGFQLPSGCCTSMATRHRSSRLVAVASRWAVPNAMDSERSTPSGLSPGRSFRVSYRPSARRWTRRTLAAGVGGFFRLGTGTQPLDGSPVPGPLVRGRLQVPTGAYRTTERAGQMVRTCGRAASFAPVATQAGNWQKAFAAWRVKPNAAMFTISGAVFGFFCALHDWRRQHRARSFTQHSRAACSPTHHTPDKTRHCPTRLCNRVKNWAANLRCTV